MTQFMYPPAMAAGGPAIQPGSPTMYYGQHHLGAWYPQDDCRQTYGFNGPRPQDANFLPFARQVPHYQQRHLQQPQPFYAAHWIDPRFFTRPLPADPTRQTAPPVSTPPQPPVRAPVPDAPRGPPRKPKQSGHAVWIGNLPVNTTIHELKDYCSQDATDDIESVFLISKSNCAFANYRSHATCEAAMYRIQSTSFRGRRLVCRLRMQQNPAGSSGTVKSASSVGSYDSTMSTIESSSNASTPEPDHESQPVIVGGDASPTVDKSTDIKPKLRTDSAEPLSLPTLPKIPERYFIIKSLCVEDLIASVNNGSWEAQRHNEKTLCEAFASTTNVYLIFSANKSGEYFGLARMKSAMYTKQIDRAPVVLPSPTDAPASPTEPFLIHTTANDVAPSGKIYDDSARGTIFWEADQAVKADEVVVGEAGKEERQQYDVEWLSTSRVPFYRTRGLRNPWNGLKEVKIARDGTELEPGVGRHMMGLFRSG